MDSYAAAVSADPRVVVTENRPTGKGRRTDEVGYGDRGSRDFDSRKDDADDKNDGKHVVEVDEHYDEDEDYDDDDDDDENDHEDPYSSKTDTGAGCSSASDTDFYYEDRSECHRMHTTVVELRAEEVERTDAVQEEFEDSLITVEDHRSRRTVEIVTKHRHVLSETCRVKVQNLRYNNTYCVYARY